MSVVIALSLVQLLLVIMTMDPAAEGRHLDVDEPSRMAMSSAVQDSDDVDSGWTTSQADWSPGSVHRLRRRYSNPAMPWDNHDMAWLKRGLPAGQDKSGVLQEDMDKPHVLQVDRDRPGVLHVDRDRPGVLQVDKSG